MQLFKGINVVSIAVPDLDAARTFYGEVLGLGAPLYDLPEAGWIEFQTGAPAGNLAGSTKARARLAAEHRHHDRAEHGRLLRRMR